MMEVGIIGKKANCQGLVEWQIDDFFSAAEDINVEPYDSPVFKTAYYSWDLRHRNIVCLQSPTFAVENTSWHLRLWPKWCTGRCLDIRCPHPKYVTVFLVNYKDRDYDIDYEFLLKNRNDFVITGTMKGGEHGSGPCILIKISDLELHKSNLVPGNVLTIICTMMRDVTNSNQTSELENPKPTKFIRLDRLSENFKDLLGNEETCDTILKVKSKEFKAHRLVLTTRSPVFAAAFKHDTLEKQTGVICIPDCEPDSFSAFLEYLYTGKVFRDISFHSTLTLYYTSEKYGLPELKEYCVKHLIQSLTAENVCEVVVFADKHFDDQLHSAVQDFFTKHAFEIILTSEWDDLLSKNQCLASKLLKEMAKEKLSDVFEFSE